jgi:hypothetical protein
VHSELASGVAPVLHDLRSAGALLPRIGDTDVEPGGDLVGVWFHAPDGSGQVVSVARGRPLCEQVAQAADQIQEWAVEALWRAGRSALWPECAAHPGSHPLAAEVRGGSAVWVCPQTNAVVAVIGQLPPKSV